jgi:DNA-binding MarR family transcriptional regulator
MSEPFYTPADFVPQRSIGYLVHRLKKLGLTRGEAMFAELDISFSQWVAMFHLKHGMADNAAQIARCLGHNSGAVTRMLDQLEERGLIERTRDKADRRIVIVALTEAGSALLDRLTPMVMDLWNEHLAVFSRGEVETLIKQLTRLLATFEVDEEQA